MIGFFGWLIWMGPLALALTTFAVQVKCFQEIIAVGYAVYRVHGLPWFRSISWFFLLASNYFIYGEGLAEYFGVLLNRAVSSPPTLLFSPPSSINRIFDLWSHTIDSYRFVCT